MPGRTYSSSLNFPYGYQGQEKDAETGLTNFELRQYDGRIGRWYNPDPNGQHHSPYLAMGNNPVSSIDPDGGWDGPGGGPNSDDAWRDYNFAQMANPNNHFNGDADAYVNGIENMAIVKNAYNTYRAKHTNAKGEWGNWMKGQDVRGLDDESHMHFDVDESAKIDNSIFSKPPASGIYYVFEQYTPNIYRNISGFLKERPDWQYLHYIGKNKEDQDRNRSVISQILPPALNWLLSRDEFPMASTFEGGDPATLKVRYVPALENSIQGGQLSWVYRGLSRGDVIKVVPVPKGGIDSPIYKPSPIDVSPIAIPLLMKKITELIVSPKPVISTPVFIPIIPIMMDEKMMRGEGEQEFN